MPFHKTSVPLLISLLCSPALATAQDSPASPAPEPASAKDHAHDRLELDRVVVSSAPFGRNQVELSQASTLLSGLELDQQRQPSLGETLAGLPGVSSTWYGPGASRPIVRGQGGDRLKILENGASTLDASATSPDHAVAIEPFLVKRIEVVRGPASLLYGSSAVAGAVNVITHRIHETPEEAEAGGLLSLRYDGANEALSAGAAADLPLWRSTRGKPLVLSLHLDASRRTADDLRIPGEAERHPGDEDEDHEEEAGHSSHGLVPNTALTADGASAGLSLTAADFHAGLAWSGHNTRYGVPGHHHHAHEEEELLGASAAPGEDHDEEDGVTIDLRQRRVDFQAGLERSLGPFNAARLKYSNTHYIHREIEPSGETGTVFRTRGHEARLDLAHGGADSGLAGTLGLQQGRVRLEALGEEAFVPPSVTDTAALFAFEEFAFRPASLQLGARLESQCIRAQTVDGRRRETLFGFSGGVLRKLGGDWSLAGHLSHGTRAPGAQELFAEGPHAGTASYERGEPGLDLERVTHAELALRRSSGFVTGEISVFSQHYSNYIHSLATGQVAIEGPDGFELVQPGSPGAEEGLPVYQQVQGRARFVGAELETRWHLHEGERHAFDLRAGADFVRASGPQGPLPRIPAARTKLGLEWRHGDWGLGVDWTHGFRQTRVAGGEESSPSHDLLGAGVTRCLHLGRLEADVFVRAFNLLDREIRPHTSFLRDLVPLPGRSVSVGLVLRY